MDSEDRSLIYNKQLDGHPEDICHCLDALHLYEHAGSLLCLKWILKGGTERRSLAVMLSSETWALCGGWLFVFCCCGASVFLQGNCYVWNLAGGMGDEVTQLIPKTKIPAHKRYSLRCKFSPDSTWVHPPHPYPSTRFPYVFMWGYSAQTLVFVACFWGDE